MVSTAGGLRIPRAMRAYEIGDQSSEITLRMVERPVPAPAHGEVLLKVLATGLNARDLLMIRSGGGWKRPASHIPLNDNASEVVALGPDVTGLTIGDIVCVTEYPLWLDGKWDADYARTDIGNSVDGFLCEYKVIPARSLVKLPSTMPVEQSCTLAIAGLTAWRSIAVEAQPKPGETVLTIGTGGVSVFNLQVAKSFGCNVIITSSSDEKLERMKALGADMTVNYRTHPEWDREVFRLTNGYGADIVLNNIGYPELERCMRTCATNARVIHIGASRQQVEMRPLANMLSMVSIKGVAVGSRRMLEDFVKAATLNNLRPVVDQVFPFDRAADAVRTMMGSDRVGKIVIRVS